MHTTEEQWSSIFSLSGCSHFQEWLGGKDAFIDTNWYKYETNQSYSVRIWSHSIRWNLYVGPLSGLVAMAAEGIHTRATTIRVLTNDFSVNPIPNELSLIPQMKHYQRSLFAVDNASYRDPQLT